MTNPEVHLVMEEIDTKKLVEEFLTKLDWYLGVYVKFENFCVKAGR